MARAKVHNPKARHKAANEPVLSFCGSLVQVNIKTGESCCRLRELWESQGWVKLPNKEGGTYGRL